MIGAHHGLSESAMMVIGDLGFRRGVPGVRWNSELSDEHRRRGRIKQDFRTHCALMKLVEGRARLRVGPGDCRGEG